jgi:hypothetical protein
MLLSNELGLTTELMDAGTPRYIRCGSRTEMACAPATKGELLKDCEALNAVEFGE